MQFTSRRSLTKSQNGTALKRVFQTLVIASLDLTRLRWGTGPGGWDGGEGEGLSSPER